MKREIILDTETTGLDPKEGHKIIEVGAIEMINKVLTGKKFHYYINPERDVPAESYRYHGIAGEFLKDKPKFIEIAQGLLEFIKDSSIVAHNAAFDAKFLNYELAKVNLPQYPDSQFIDTLAIARRLFPGARANLDALCVRFKVDNSARKFHGALLDAALLADVYVELCGGRQASFILRENKIEENANIDKNFSTKITTRTIEPTAEELQKHKNFIATIPNPLWY